MLNQGDFKMINKRIGIPGYQIGENTFGVNTSYLEFISKFGIPVILTPQDVHSPPDIDLLVLPGGPDILPNKYGKSPSYKINKPSPMLEYFDEFILPQYFSRRVPIFAICRGMQLIWIMNGGELNQNNEYHIQSTDQNNQCHELIFTPKYQKLDKYIDKVTSRHHQTCMAYDDNDLDIIPNNINVIAYSAANKKKLIYQSDVVEIFEDREYPLYAVQYHPENHDKTDKLSSMFINKLLGNIKELI